MTSPTKPKSVNTNDRRVLLETRELFARKPFQPHPLFTTGHAQTLAAYAWPRRISLRTNDEARLFQVAPDAQVLAHCRWQADRHAYPTMVVWHGMEGSTESVYMLAMAKKGFAAGMNVVRVNFRNCGGTEHLTPTLYHGGLSEDLRAVIEELIEQDGLSRVIVVGFSLGGNMVLKLAGEYGPNHPKQLLGVCAVSPSVDLAISVDTMSQRANWLYHQSFLGRLKKRIQIKNKLYPDVYDISDLPLARSVREFDERFTSRAHGFDGADDYYRRASSIQIINQIRIPTLIIHAKDDPFIPFEPLSARAVGENPNILMIATEHGGHVAFLSTQNNYEDRFWAENRAIDFCRLASE